MAYDIFISYRRKGAGAGVAGEMQSKLENLGYKVFLDVDSIGSGDFPKQIEQAIQQCNDFLLVLSPGMLDRCSDENDWVRHEIFLAEKFGKNIIGVSLPGFVMPTPEALPPDLHEIPEKQVFVWSHEYRHASFEKIVDNLLTTSLKKKRTKRNYLWIVVAVVLIGGGLSWLVSSGNSEEPGDGSLKEKDEMVIDYRKVFVEAVNDTFASYLKTGDSLLSLVPETPSEQQDFALFMHGIGEYKAAMEYESDYPGVVTNKFGAKRVLDSLMVVRKNRFNGELEAANQFLNADLVDFARYRFANAEVLSLPDEQSMLDAVAKRFPD